MVIILEKKTKSSSEKPDPIDIHVGARVRMRRNLAGLSQEQLGKSLGLTFQQVQKYERGTNRMGSSRLFQIATVLSVPVSYFFEGMNLGIDSSMQPELAKNGQIVVGSTVSEKSDCDNSYSRETLELVRTYYRIKNLAMRRKVYELVRALSVEK